MTLEEFLSSPVRNAWLSEPGIEIYVRKANRYVDDNVVPVLDIANVGVDGEQQRRGIFKNWLSKAETLASGKFGYVVIENVVNAHLPAFLERSGYRAISWLQSSYVKSIP